MKTLKNLCITVLCLLLLGACEKNLVQPSPTGSGQSGSSGENCDGHKDFRTLPFKASFYTIRSYEEGPGACTEDPFLEYNLQLGGGTATHLGKFTVTIWFCGSGFDYKNGEGVFATANGDELYFQIPSPDEVGHVVPYDDPFYDFSFQDPFTITGGSGHFEGASGRGHTDSFVNLFDDQGDFIPEHKTDHQWEGILVLPKNITEPKNGPCHTYYLRD